MILSPLFIHTLSQKNTNYQLLGLSAKIPHVSMFTICFSSFTLHLLPMLNTFLNLWLLQVNSAVKVKAVVNLAKNVMKKSHSPWVQNTPTVVRNWILVQRSSAAVNEETDKCPSFFNIPDQLFSLELTTNFSLTLTNKSMLTTASPCLLGQWSGRA